MNAKAIKPKPGQLLDEQMVIVLAPISVEEWLRYAEARPAAHRAWQNFCAWNFLRELGLNKQRN